MCPARTSPDGETASEWFWWMTAASVSWLMLATYLYAFRFDARRLPRVERGLALFVAAGTVLTMPDLLPLTLLVQHGINLVVALTVNGVLTALALRGGSRELRVIVLALWACLGFAVHDWLLVAVRISPEGIYLLPYGSLLLVGSFLYVASRWPWSRPNRPAACWRCGWPSASTSWPRSRAAARRRTQAGPAAGA